MKPLDPETHDRVAKALGTNRFGYFYTNGDAYMRYDQVMHDYNNLRTMFAYRGKHIATLDSYDFEENKPVLRFTKAATESGWAANGPTLGGVKVIIVDRG
jgi:hypothetical protein